MNLNTLGRKIKENRLKLGLTQEDLANILHVSNKAVSKWENNRCYPDICLLEDIAKTLNISVSELIGEESINLELLKKLQDNDMKLKNLYYIILMLISFIVITSLNIILIINNVLYPITICICFSLIIISRQIINHVVYKEKLWDITFRNL